MIYQTFPASYTLVTRLLSRGVKRPERGIKPTQYSADVKQTADLYFYILSGLS